MLDCVAGSGEAVDADSADPADLAVWDGVADRYVAMMGGQDSFFRRLQPFLEAQFAELTGRTVLDVGCGPGWVSEWLRQRGAHVTGVDGSARLLEMARAAYPEVGFRQNDLTTGLPRPLSAVDRVVAHMVLMDLPELDLLMADIRASLAPGGVFVFSILHPAFFGQAVEQDASTGQRYRTVESYLEPRTRWIDTFGGHRHYHRPLSQYVQVLRNHGLVITDLQEPPTLPATATPPEEWTEYEAWFATIPTMIAFACQAR